MSHGCGLKIQTKYWTLVTYILIWVRFSGYYNIFETGAIFNRFCAIQLFQSNHVITLVVLNFYYFTDVDDDYCILYGSWGRGVAVVFI